MISIADMVAIGTATATKTYCKVILPCARKPTQPGSTSERRTPQRAATPERPRPIAGSPSAVVRIRSRGRRAARRAVRSGRSRHCGSDRVVRGALCGRIAAVQQDGVQRLP
jgi:hypothetical protein